MLWFIILRALFLPLLVGSVCLTPSLNVPSDPDDIILSDETADLGLPIFIINDIRIDFGPAACTFDGFVRVDVFVVNGSGQLSLNADSVGLAEFSLCVLRWYPGQQGSNWSCQGNGSGRNMTFVAAKRDINLIFTNMTFTPYFRDYQEDFISIRVYDGAGGPCLDVDEHEMYGKVPLKSRCTKTSVSIRTPRSVEPKLSEEDEESKGFLADVKRTVVNLVNNHGQVVLGIGIFLVVVIFGGLGLYWRRRSKKDEDEPPSNEPIRNEQGVIGPFENQEAREMMLEWANAQFGTEIHE